MITVAEEVERAVQRASNFQQSLTSSNHQSLMSSNLNQNMAGKENLTSSKLKHKPAKQQSVISPNLNQLRVACPVEETTDCITLSSDEEVEEGVHDVNMGGVEVKKKANMLSDKKIKKGPGGKRSRDSSSEEKFLKSKVRKEKKSNKDGNENLKQLKAQSLPDFPRQNSMGTGTHLKHQLSNQKRDIAAVTTGPPSWLSASSSHQQLGETDASGHTPYVSPFSHEHHEANASPAFPPAGSHKGKSGPPLHSLKPMLGGSHFDGSIVLCEEVRVKMEGTGDTGAEEQEPLICESKQVYVSELGRRKGNRAVRVKECSVMLKRRILDEESPWRAGDHIKLDNWGKEPLGCKMSDGKRFGQQGLGNHGMGVVCNECGNRFVNERTLMMHKKRVHQGEPRNQQSQVKCKIVGCENPFYSRFGVHMRMMHGQPKLKCQFDNCDAEFYSSQGLKKHTAKKHERTEV